jgi:hypothetical protein
LAAGKKLYEEQCSGCHGVKGEGDGSKTAGKEVPSWAKQERLAKLSAQDIAAIIAAGQGDMPAFNNLSEEDRLSLAVYIRNLTYSSTAQNTASTGSESSSTREPSSTTPDSQSTNATPVAQADVPVGTLVIQGKITAQGDGIETGGLPVKLLGFEGMNQTLEQKATSSAEGTYEFKVENKTGMAYMVQADYEGNPYNSDILHSKDVIESPANLPVVIYPTTTDTSALSIDRMHVFFDFSVPGKVQIAELFILSNAGQAVVVSNDPEKPAVTFRLPAGAADLQFQGGALGDRFVETKDGFGDLSAVEPGKGQHQVLFSYTLPYGKKLDLAIPVPMDAAAAVVMMPEGGVRIQSSQLTDAGKRDVQGVPYNLYSASNLSAGSDLSIKLSGNMGGVGSQPESTTSGMVIGLGVFGLVLIGAGIWLFRSRGAIEADSAGSDTKPAETETEDGLLDAILALDDLHQAGEIPEVAYQQRRADLKARLKALKGS